MYAGEFSSKIAANAKIISQDRHPERRQAQGINFVIIYSYSL